MLQPKRRTYRKDFRGRRMGMATRGVEVSFGEYGLKALENAWLAAKQIEAARRAITHFVKKGGKVWVRVFPDKPVTGRPAGMRMGRGKGEIDRYVAVIRRGKVLFEVAGIPESVVTTAFARAGAKLPFKTRMVKKD
ncbi:50S ribosomal protein L16 [Candidatus Woesebacteria bacterium RIFOXYA1_FULL_43_9]|uniref:Large ribosomal subunit protein uL16 n=1 Tax=Candidatus Woesebacteria bacterium RIFOXYA1_FULL_43_9 TaxID=1802534 RepID=A0A1F8CLE0_9BACT|nr:MAG: 50S ribosomal protein L16 [Candidatus Woesebacteria bacterium RIFOXYA1_FULL_43_9]